MRKPYRLIPAMLAAAAAAIATPAALAFDSGSTGADGALAPTVNTEIQLPPSGILNYTSINIPAGVTVKFKKNALNTPVYLLVSGDVTVSGIIDLDGTDSPPAGTYGNGNTADDGMPGRGGPGGYDGGRGGRDDPSLRPDIIRGGAGLGPGGGRGGIESDNGGGLCSAGRYYRYGLGASHAQAGSNHYFAIYCGASFANLSVAAKPYGSNALQPLLGGSGGGGGTGGSNYAGVGGGGGGGAILIAASGTIDLKAGSFISANGGSAGGFAGTGAGDWAGGGSGGAVRLIATNLRGNGTINTYGGCATENGNRSRYCGVDAGGLGGSFGRVRLEAETITFSGATNPAYTTDSPGPIFLSNVPSLRIATVAGTAVPAVPTGNADVTLPANLTNPVAVTFQTTNVPTGNTVLLKVVPAYGSPIEVISPAISGTAANGTASVQVALPQGPSVLQATTTYTVVVAMGDALSQFANNERVEKVQLTATLGARGESQVKLITVTGKEYLVPSSVLQIAGFAG